MSKRKGMTCEQIELLLGAFADGELNSRQTAAVQQHLGGCPSCARRLDELQRLSLLVDEAVCDETMPAHLHASVMRVVRETKPQKRPAFASAWRRFGTVAVCGLCLVVVAVALMAGGGDKALMEGVFDSNVMSPDASGDAETPDGGHPLWDKSESADDSYHDIYNGIYDTPTSPDTPQEPMMPEDPMAPNEPLAPDAPDTPKEPDLPTADEVSGTYRLARADGLASETLDGEWVGEELRLTLYAKSGEAKVAYSDRSAYMATYEAKNGVLTLVDTVGEIERFEYRFEEGVLWLTRK